MAVELNSGNGGSNSFVAFMLGVVLVIVGAIGFFMWDNYKSHQGAPTAPIHVTIKK